MCGIAAIIDPAGTAEGPDRTAARQRELAAMLGRIRHRGDPGCFGESRAEAGAALGTNRLAIVDREHARQPQSDPTGRYLLAYNGELYGFRQLRAELERRGHAFRTASDTEVVVHAYLEWGEAMLDRFNGMFAFVLYDRVTGGFLAARDHIGIKPLYYAVRDGEYRFASEQKCLLGFSSDIRVVAPGTYLRDGREHRWFHLDDTPLELTEREAVERYGELFEAAVRGQLDTDLPVAVAFSGGIDSAAVLAVALEHHPDVTAVTVGFDGAADLAVARRYCRERGVRQIVSRLDAAGLVSVIPEVVRGTEFFEAVDVMDSCVGYFVYRAARRHGFKLALCGEGSDEVLAGYDLFATHPDPAGLMRYRVGNLHRTDLQRVDRTSMMHSIETRVPFMDRYLLEFAYRVPMRMKLRGGVEKWLLREAFRDRLPAYVRDRRKIRMPDGSGMKNTLAEYAAARAGRDDESTRRLGIDTPQGRYFLRAYLEAGFPPPGERNRRVGHDYSPNGYFEFVA
ncbi:asparagine synthetase B [Nonomuraea sp. NPDC050783]|uniref:asparagine synthetase B family protein n=1 Tax=Nonomuraea sp. NPDC050783 TaxID=3154634 RepID=UPI00346711A8